MSIEARFRVERKEFTLDVSLQLPGQGITAIFGPSGSGKTTLLRCLAGLERSPAGYLSVAGNCWQDGQHFMPTHQRPLGYVFQEASLFPHLTVRDNLDYGQRRCGATYRRPAGVDFLQLLGIELLLERRPDSLSGGERQRVAIARALLTTPQLLLMDEPLAALDLARKNEILPYLERLRDELAIPVIYVSHSADEVARLAEHIVVMEHGMTIAQGPLGTTLASLDLPIRLGEDAGVVLDATIAERDAPWHLARAEFPGGSLWIRDTGLPPGRRVRLRILARDLSLARDKVEGTSIQNMLPAKIGAIGDDNHPALCLVRLNTTGGQPLLARLTRRAVATLELAVGQSVWVQVKAVALIG